MPASERRRASRRAKELRAEGLSMGEISKRLHGEGFSGREGIPYSQASVSRLSRRKSTKKKKKVQGASIRPQQGLAGKKTAKARLDGVLQILKTDLDPEERIALALLLGDA